MIGDQLSAISYQRAPRPCSRSQFVTLKAEVFWLYKRGSVAARFRPISEESILQYTDLAALIQMARARGWSTIRIVRTMSLGLTYADALNLARKAAPLLDISASEFMRCEKTSEIQASSSFASKRSL